MTTYDDTRALVHVRKRMRSVLVAFGVASLGIAALAPPLALRFDGAGWVPAVAIALLTLAATVAMRRLGSLRDRLWRVSVSPRHLSVLDAGRRQRTICWNAVERVSICPRGVTVRCRSTRGGTVRVLIRGSYATWIDLAHHVVSVAERYRIPIWVDGRPWQALNVHDLYPTLRSDLTGA